MPDPVQPRLYKLLGVAQDASQPDITQAYRRRARELHPDLAETDGGNEAFTALTRAYRLLSDPTQRAAYDATLRNARSSTTPTRYRSLSGMSQTVPRGRRNTR